jgi:hypothetical protein
MAAVIRCEMSSERATKSSGNYVRGRPWPKGVSGNPKGRAKILKGKDILRRIRATVDSDPLQLILAEMRSWIEAGIDATDPGKRNMAMEEAVRIAQIALPYTNAPVTVQLREIEQRLGIRKAA